MLRSLKLRSLLLYGALKDQPVKRLVVTLAIAIGVCLGLAVHLIHKQALTQFESGVRQFSGQADVQFVPYTGHLADEVVGTLQHLEEVANASPVIKAEVFIEQVERPVTWYGVDVFRAGPVTPDLVGNLAKGQEGLAFLLPDSVFISPSLESLLPPFGEQQRPTELVSTRDEHKETWKIVGKLNQTSQADLVVVSDIASMQTKFSLVGKLSQVDLKLSQGVDPKAFRMKYAKQLEGIGRFESTEEQASRGATVSQAYRANLSILAMVALLTGGFLSFSTQMLSVAQRARQWALLGAMGMSEQSLARQIFFESSVSGLVGGLFGLLLGWLLANFILVQYGVDLGAGYFSSQAQAVHLSPVEAIAFLLFSWVATFLGALLPAKQARHASLSGRLRSGSEEAGLRFVNQAPMVALLLLSGSALALLIPPFESIPIGGYLSIAMGLFGGIALIGQVIKWLIKPPKRLARLTDLAATRMAATPNLLAVGLSGVVASFALVVAMHIMIHSFRHSLDDWLTKVLPAPLYVSLTDESSLTALPPALISKLSGLPTQTIQTWGQTDLSLEPARPPVQLIIRPVTLSNVQDTLPMTGEAINAFEPGYQPVWPSEPAAKIYGLKVGDKFTIPVAPGIIVNAQVAGIWRDYGRQHGALVLSQQDMRTNFNYDLPPTQLAAWPASGSINLWMAEVTRFIDQNQLQGQLRVARPEAIRQASLDIFDRSFAITYLLEMAAIVIGLFGVATTFSAIAMSRTREFALIAAIGGSSNSLNRLSIAEGVLAAWIATLVGLSMGLAFAAVLVFIVNPQSFHWTMQWNVPWRDLTLMAVSLILIATLTVSLSARRANTSLAVAILKEDWA